MKTIKLIMKLITDECACYSPILNGIKNYCDKEYDEDCCCRLFKDERCGYFEKAVLPMNPQLEALYRAEHQSKKEDYELSNLHKEKPKEKNKVSIQKNPEKPEDCRHWDYCNASICPLEDKIKNLNYIYYPDEEICRLRNVPDWVKTQKKIKKKARDIDKYFTFEMLNRNFIIKIGIVGLDPDQEETPQLKKWLKYHPIKKQFSEAEKKVMVKRFRDA